MVEKRPLVLINLLAALLLMALTSFLPAATPTSHHHHHHSDDGHGRKKNKKQLHSTPRTRTPSPPSSSSSSSWEQFKSLLSCRSTAATQVHDPSSTAARLGRAACGSSICAIRDVVHGNTRVVHRSDTDLSSDASSIAQHETAPLARAARSARHHPPVSSLGCRSHSRGGIQLPKLSGCYECHAVSIEPSSRRYPRPRTTLCACSECGEVFTKPDSLELHQAIRHAVSELGPEDSGRNIVEIIFKSSWQKKDRPICKIERILKVHSAPRTVARFEDYRAAVKSRALPHLSASAARHHHPSRCAADGNELLRFHCTSLSCPLGARGSTSLCPNSSSSSPSSSCGVCTVIRHGFARAQYPHGVRTTASSGRAHDSGPSAAAEDGRGERRAMLVCRVIAGRVRRTPDDPAAEEAYDAVAVGDGRGAYGNLEELIVANPRAILPCFVVIYRAIS
ncbi:C2H2 zinc finger protein [Musa troglodytarum]|nr:C2H2 zinc finger protein [Musa troglodytarum]